MARFLVQRQLDNGLVHLLVVDVYSKLPSDVRLTFRLVLEEFEPANLRVSVTGDQDGVYKDKVLQLSGDGPMKPTLLLIGKRLGHDNVNPLYYKSLKVSTQCGLSLILGITRTSTVGRNSWWTTLFGALFLCLSRRLLIFPRSSSYSTSST